MFTQTIPAEIWRVVLGHAIRDPYRLKTEWDFEPEDDLWIPWTHQNRESQEELDDQRLLQRARFQTGLTIIRVCQTWRALAIGFVYEYFELRWGSDGDG